MSKVAMCAGIDYSYTTPAIAIHPMKPIVNFNDVKVFFYTSETKYKSVFNKNIYGMSHIPYESEMERFDNIAQWAMAILKKFKVTEACLEGYAMGAKGKVFNIAENTALLKYQMWKHGIEYYIPSPMTVKKDFSGKGNSNKEAMHNAFIEKTSIDITQIINVKAEKSPISDIVDSYAMLCYGIDYHFK
jgi:Holliday junction resolvasome RuvABC endonuclease subunit